MSLSATWAISKQLNQIFTCQVFAKEMTQNLKIDHDDHILQWQLRTDQLSNR